jgi:hypothetical protein
MRATPEPTSHGPLTPETIAALYPRLYSEKRLGEWEALFDDRALAVKTVPGGLSTHLNIHDAMPEQWEYADENDVLTEKWDKIEIHRYGNIAVIKADYTLTADAEVRKGVDVLTLVNGRDGWRIVNLAYEQTDLITR